MGLRGPQPSALGWAALGSIYARDRKELESVVRRAPAVLDQAARWRQDRGRLEKLSSTMEILSSLTFLDLCNGCSFQIGVLLNYCCSSA